MLCLETLTIFKFFPFSFCVLLQSDLIGINITTVTTDMSLSTTQKGLRVIKRDLTVYKVIKVRPEHIDKRYGMWKYHKLLKKPNDYRYVSLYRGKRVSRECVEDMVAYEASGKVVRHDCGLRVLSYQYPYYYGSGLVHTFRRRWDAIECAENDYLNHYVDGDPVPYIVYKCIIPKGTEYVHGVDINNFDSYASKKIVFVKPVYFEDVAKEWYKRITVLRGKKK